MKQQPHELRVDLRLCRGRRVVCCAVGAYGASGVGLRRYGYMGVAVIRGADRKCCVMWRDM